MISKQSFLSFRNMLRKQTSILMAPFDGNAPVIALKCRCPFTTLPEMLDAAAASYSVYCHLETENGIAG